MKVFQRETHLRTVGWLAVRDITDEVNEAVRESGVQDGIACIYSPHTTCCVRVNEFEQGFLEDFSELLRRLGPPDNYYAHDDWDRRTENICPEDMEKGNGHSHCMAMLLGTAGESVPSATASSSSAPGSACSSSSSTASATGAGSSRSSATSAGREVSCASPRAPPQPARPAAAPPARARRPRSRGP